MIEALLLAWSLLCTLVWLGGLLRTLRRARDDTWRLGPEAPAAASNLRASILIPARDEVEDIAPCVRSCLAQDHPRLEVIVLDDGSTDGTAEVLSELQAEHPERLLVISGGSEPLPEGWLGKPWACHRAAARAGGDYLLFLDADVRLRPEALSRTMAHAEEEGVDLLSGFGELDVRSFGEILLQPVVAATVLADNPLSAVNDPEQPEEALANGQFLLFRREAYEALGGHRAVAAEVVDDQAFARAVKGCGGRLRMLMLRRLFSCRMYTSFGEVWRGWRKNLFPGMDRSWARLGLVVLAGTLLSVGPYLLLLLALIGLLPRSWALYALAPVGAMQLLRAYLDGLFGLPRWIGLLTHGLANALVIALFIDSAIATTRGRARWKGRPV